MGFFVVFPQIVILIVEVSIIKLKIHRRYKFAKLVAIAHQKSLTRMISNSISESYRETQFIAMKLFSFLLYTTCRTFHRILMIKLPNCRGVVTFKTLTDSTALLVTMR